MSCSKRQQCEKAVRASSSIDMTILLNTKKLNDIIITAKDCGNFTPTLEFRNSRNDEAMRLIAAFKKAIIPYGV